MQWSNQRKWVKQPSSSMACTFPISYAEDTKSLDEDINKCDSKGRTSLHYAAQKLLGVTKLLSSGADPNIQDHSGHTAMHLAAIEGFDRIVETLLEYKANPDILNCFHRLPIHYLAKKNHEEGIEAIAAAGGDLDTMDQDGFTPLYWAVKNNRPDAVKALLRANCCTEVGSCMPVKLALDNCQYAMAKIIILSGCDMKPVAEWWSQMSCKDAIESTSSKEPSFWPQVEQGDGEQEAERERKETAERERREAAEWLGDWLHIPHCLQQLCRMAIRRQVGRRLYIPGHESSARPKLPLPPALTDYVTLKDVSEQPVSGFGRWKKGLYTNL